METTAGLASRPSSFQLCAITASNWKEDGRHVHVLIVYLAVHQVLRDTFAGENGGDDSGGLGCLDLEVLQHRVVLPTLRNVTQRLDGGVLSPGDQLIARLVTLADQGSHGTTRGAVVHANENIDIAAGLGEAIFGKGAPPVVAALPLPGGDETPSVEPPSAAEDAAGNETAPAVSPEKKPEQVSKAVLLAKLRDRLKDAGPGAK